MTRKFNRQVGETDARAEEGSNGDITAPRKGLDNTPPAQTTFRVTAAIVRLTPRCPVLSRPVGSLGTAAATLLSKPDNVKHPRRFGWQACCEFDEGMRTNAAAAAKDLPADGRVRQQEAQ